MTAVRIVGKLMETIVLLFDRFGPRGADYADRAVILGWICTGKEGLLEIGGNFCIHREAGCI